MLPGVCCTCSPSISGKTPPGRNCSVWLSNWAPPRCWRSTGRWCGRPIRCQWPVAHRLQLLENGLAIAAARPVGVPLREVHRAAIAVAGGKVATWRTWIKWKRRKRSRITIATVVMERNNSPRSPILVWAFATIANVIPSWPGFAPAKALTKRGEYLGNNTLLYGIINKTNPFQSRWAARGRVLRSTL